MQNNKRRQADRRAVCGFIGSCKSATSENKCKTRTSLASDDNYKQIKRRKRTEIRTTRTTTSGNLVSFSIGAAILLLVPVILIKPDHCQCLETPKGESCQSFLGCNKSDFLCLCSLELQQVANANNLLELAAREGRWSGWPSHVLVERDIIEKKSHPLLSGDVR